MEGIGSPPRSSPRLKAPPRLQPPGFASPATYKAGSPTIVRPFDADELEASPASSAMGQSRSPAGLVQSPTTSPMSSSGASSQVSTDGTMTGSLSSASDASGRTPTRLNAGGLVSLEDYDSGEEKTYHEGKHDASYDGGYDDEGTLSDGAAPSLEGSPVQMGLHARLRDMGFRETIARAATEHCDDVSVAVQYASDYQIHRSAATHNGGTASSYSAYASPSADYLPPSSSGSSPHNQLPSPRSPGTMLQSATEYSASFTHYQIQQRRQQSVNASTSASNSSSSSSSPLSSLATPSHLDGASSKHGEGESKDETRRDVLQRHLLQLGFDRSDVKSAVRRCSSTPAAARFIMDGGVAGWERKTAATVFECGICMSDDIGEEDMITLSCNHRFCKLCMLPFIASLIESHKVLDNEDFVCPEIGCMAPLDLPIVKELVSAPAFERLLDLKLRKEYAETREEVRTCPKCEVMVVIEDVKQNSKLLDSLTCINNNCKHKFCGRCGLSPHKNQKDLDVSCEDYAAFVEANDKSAQIFEAYLRDNNMKRCPKCLLPAELKSGCHFIRCVCKTSYCYLCGRELFEHSHYSHYHKGPYSKKCFGGAKDKKGYIALPACEGCEGRSCKKCAKSCEEEKRKRLEKISEKASAKGVKNGRTGLVSWFTRMRDMRRQRRRK